MLNFELEEIDFENIGAWPLYFKVAVLVISVITIYFLMDWLLISGKQEKLEGLISEEERQREFFINKEKALFDIKDYKKQLQTIESRLAKLTKKLPGVNELPNLINQISQAGHVSGLSFKEIKILPEKKFKYYVELPINIKVEGNYHQFGDFIGKVSNMPRVITFHDLSLGSSKVKNSDANNLEMQVLAKTYRYVELEEDDTNEESKNKRGKKAK